jgi:hypothetical protein
VRQGEGEAGSRDTLCELRRARARNELRLGRVLEHLAIDDVTDDEVDQALDTVERRRAGSSSGGAVGDTVGP